MSHQLTSPERQEGHFATPLLEGALYGAAREFLSRPSKGLRARMIEVSYAVAGGSESVPRAAVDMIELLHSGSLIVDDIQDSADLRRGGQALHQLIGVPRALNTGNWLYFVALTRLDELALDDAHARALARATHRCLVDCHEGQSLDLALKVADVNRTELPSVAKLVTLLKTGEPMALAARLGATIAGATTRGIEALVAFGKNVGLALQMLDDLGSLVALSRHHKGLEDLRNQRVSWVWAWASEVLDAATFEGLIAQLADESLLPPLCARLADIVEPVGRARVRSLLESTERDLQANFPPSRVLDVVHADLTRLERSYG
jgi:geranylgeranyl pyrophosphate synthase